MNLSKSLEENYNHIKTDFVDCSDFLIRKAKTGNREFLIMVCDGLIDSLQLSQMVVSPILRCDEIDIDTIKKSITNSVELNEAETFADCYYYVMSGFAVVLVFNLLRHEVLMYRLMNSQPKHRKKLLLKCLTLIKHFCEKGLKLRI